MRVLAWVFAFLLAVASLEALFLARRALVSRAARGARLADALSNLGCGLGQIVTRPLYDAGFVLVYLGLYEHARLATLRERSAATWVVALFATDFLYYVYHRLAHSTRLMWSWHGVHHQSESYDLWVSFRLSWLGPPTERLFYLPLAFAGLPVGAVLAATAYNSFYQFFVHTRVVPKLGPLDWLLNTPSNHRVHHGVEDEYRDKNFGGMFVIWDRLLGSYQAEEEEPTYGVPRAFLSKNPLVANVAYFVEWARGLARSTLAPIRAPRAQWAQPVLGYAAAQTILLCALAIGALAWIREGNPLAVAALAAVILVGVSCLGVVVDASRGPLDEADAADEANVGEKPTVSRLDFAA